MKNSVQILKLRLPDDLAQALAREAALRGRSRAEILRRALVEHLEQRKWRDGIADYVPEAAQGYADPLLRRHALAVAEEAIEAGNEERERLESAGSDAGQGIWWR